MKHRSLALLPLLTLVAGCDLAPHYTRPASAAPTSWPMGPAYKPGADGPAGLPWKAMITDPKLQKVVEQALANNRDLRAAIANVQSARAEYHVQRSYQLPTIAAGAGVTVEHGESGSGSSGSGAGYTSGHGTNTLYDGNIGASSFEIDLFGRLKNETKEAFEQFLATDEGMRSTRITLIAETATAYTTMASDEDLLATARATLANGQRSLELITTLERSGLASQVDIQNEVTIVAQAQSDIASQTTLVAQDRNALQLLVGAPVADDLLPTSLDALDHGIAIVPAGLSSSVLLQRPDVLQAEHQLKATNAQIGAARAAFFPTITLTSAVGLASTALSSLFTGGALAWSVAPTASLPILGGTNTGNLEYAKAQQRYYLAEYEKAVQTAFEEVANGLARRGTIVDQRNAQDRLVTAADRSYRLSYAQYRAGTDTFLDALTAQRTLYTAQQTQISTVEVDLANRISLYEYIGADQTN